MRGGAHPWPHQQALDWAGAEHWRTVLQHELTLPKAERQASVLPLQDTMAAAIVAPQGAAARASQ